MKDKILEYIDKSKNRYSTYIKKDKELMSYIHTTFDFDLPLPEKCYLILDDLKEPPLCPCGTKVKFIGINNGYRTYCSVKCPEKVKYAVTAANLVMGCWKDSI